VLHDRVHHVQVHELSLRVISDELDDDAGDLTSRQIVIHASEARNLVSRLLVERRGLPDLDIR